MADSTSTYIIPVNLQAVRVTENDKNKFQGKTALFENVSKGLGWYVHNSLDYENGTSPIKQGVHLHWSLPDALTHGKQFSDGEIKFPSAPNRWLVTRYYCEFNTQANKNKSNFNAEPAPPEITQWIIESNSLTTEPSEYNQTGVYKIKQPPPPKDILFQPGPATIPLFPQPPNTNLPHLSEAFLGKVSDYNDQWEETQPSGDSSPDYLSDLTAIEYYGPGFSSYYQNSLSVFGFHDDFNDIQKKHKKSQKGWQELNDMDANFSVSYQVIGWYNEGSDNDILAKTLIEAQQAYKAQPPTADISELEYFYDYVAKELKWKLNEDDAPVTGNWPDSVASIYNGVALNIQWLIMETPKPNAPEFLPEPTEIYDEFKLDIAIGNNTSEAMSTMIKKDVDLPVYDPNAKDKDNDNDSSNPPPPEPFPNLEEHLEFLFNAFQQGLLRKLASSDPKLRLSQLEEYLHSARFSGHRGGSIWNLRLEPNPETNQKDTQQVEARLPLAMAQMLSHLNAQQLAYDTQTADLRSRQHQAFLDWTNLGLSNIGQQSDNEEDGGATCNIDSNDYTVRDYLTSELLQLFAESSKTGILEIDAKPGNEVGVPDFKAIWTAVNGKTEAYCIGLAKSQSSLEVLLPKALNKVQEIIEKALATLIGGDVKAGAINTLQQLSKGQIATDLQTLKTLTQQGSSNATRVQLANGLNELSGNEKLYSAVLNKGTYGTYKGPGLNDVLEAYKSSPNDGLEALKAFWEGMKTELLVANNLLDGQLIYVLAEAAFYNAFEIQVVSGPLLAAIAETEKRLAAIKTLKALINTSNSQINTCFDKINDGLETISKNVQQAIDLLNSDPTSAEAANQLMQTWILIENDLLNDQNTVVTSQGIQEVWMTLLDYLPVGHSVSILANVIQDSAEMLDQELSLVTTPAKPYYAPNDPVLLMTEPKGVDQQNVLEPVNRNGRAESLPCRRPEDLVSSMVLNGKTINTKDMAGAKVAKVSDNIKDYNTIQALLNEAYFTVPQAAYDLLDTAGLDPSILNDLISLQDQILSSIKSDQEFQKDPPLEKDSTFTYDPNSNENSVQKQESIKKKKLTTSTAAVKINFTGILPYYIGMNWFGEFSFNPFLPLYMAWTANYTPVELASEGSTNGGEFPPDYLTSNFTIGDSEMNRHVDLICKKALQPVIENVDGQEKFTLNGQITLTNRASAPLLQQIKVYFLNAIQKDITVPGSIDPKGLNDLQLDLYNTYQYFDTKVILSQAMSGFNDQLLQQLVQLSLPLNSNLRDNVDEAGFLFEFLRPHLNYPQFRQTTVGKGIAKGFFSPFRAGTMALKSIFIVDAFGRFFEMNMTEVQEKKKLYRANSLTLPPGCSNTSFPDLSNQNYLPPRIVQPSRLSFHWLSAESLLGSETTFTEHTQQPSASPICGWLFPNHLDKGLTIYDAGGHALGSLNAEGAQPTTTWRDVPKSGTGSITNTGPDNGRGAMSSTLENANYVLKNFLEKFAFPASGESPYNTLLNVMRVAQSYTQIGGLQSDKGLAVLIGQPLVLVRATLRLDLQGSPSVALDEASLCDSIKEYFKIEPGSGKPVIEPGREYNLSARNKGEFTKIEIPVMLGDLTQFNDGLVGYFINDDWNTFYSPASNNTTGRVQQSGFETLKLTPNYEGQDVADKEIQLTMIMDPRAAVHATTGILPVKQLSIPQSQYVDVMNHLLAYFITNPVLLGSKGKEVDFGNIPLPKEKQHQWLWTQPGLESDTPLLPNYVGDRAHFNFSPQQILDGWLKLEKTDQQ